jgi:hypothetical protein
MPGSVQGHAHGVVAGIAAEMRGILGSQGLVFLTMHVPTFNITTKKDMMRIQWLHPTKFVAMVPIGHIGVARLKSMRNDFNTLREGWEPYQVAVYDQMCNTLIKEILGQDRDACLEAIMAQSNWTEIPSEVLVLAYRGAGKTWLLMSAMAVFFVYVPNFSACVYAGTSNKGQGVCSSCVLC